MQVLGPSNTNNAIQFKLSGLVVDSNGNSRTTSNYFNYVASSNVTTYSTSDLCTKWTAAVWTGGLIAALNAGFTSPTICVRRLSIPSDPYSTPTTLSSVTGPSTDRLPMNDSIVIKKITGQRGKNQRAAWHFGPASESDTTKDELTGSGITNWGACVAKLHASLTDTAGNVWVPVLVHSKGSILAPVFPNTQTTIYYDIITQCSLRLTTGSMRRRIERPTVYQTPA